MAQAALHRANFQNARRPRTSQLGPLPQGSWTESQLPPKPDTSCCPHCLKSLQAGPQTTLQRIKSALVQLLTAVIAIVFCAPRLARLVIAVAFSLVGVLGFGMQSVGARVVHPDDRRLLPRLGNSR